MNKALLLNQLVNKPLMLSEDYHLALLKVAASGNAPAVDASTVDTGFYVNERYPIAFIYVDGVMVKGVSPEAEAEYGLKNIDNVRYALEDAVNDTEIEAVCLLFNSPGGQTTGIEELGRAIKAASTIKPIFAWTETMACSAAYWLASQCTKIGMTPSAQVGSIGVFSLITDASEALAKEGLKIEAISSGKFKLMGHNFRALTDEERKILQDDVNAQHAKFKSVIVEARSVSEQYMTGLAYEGQEALDANLCDIACDTLEEFLSTPELQKDITMRLTKKEVEVTKEAVAAPIVTQAAAPTEAPVEPKKEEAAPKDEPKEDPKEASAEAKHMVECPHCKQQFELAKKCEEPDGDEPKKEEAAPKEDPKEDPKEVPAEPKKEEVAPAMDFYTAFSIPRKQENSNPFLKAMVDAFKQG